MLTLYTLVGIPGAGKSVLAQTLAEENDAMIVSSDAIRGELYGDEAVQKDPAKVFRLVEERVVCHLNNGVSVVMDATNINAKRRRTFLNAVRLRVRADYVKECHVVMCDPAIAIERDLTRDRTVGKDVILKMVKGFQPPMLCEGWDDIKVYWSSKRLDMATLLMQTCDFDQHNPHHTLTLGDHMISAVDALEEPSHQLETATACHDIGKLFSQTFDEDDIAHYYDHDSIGSYIYLCTDYAYNQNSVEGGVYVCEIASLIAWHMLPYFCKGEEGYRVVAKRKNWPDWFIESVWKLHEADKEAH